MFENGFLVSPEIIKNRERIEEKYIDKFLQHDSTQFTKPPKKLLKKNQELTFCSNSITNLDKINDNRFNIKFQINKNDEKFTLDNNVSNNFPKKKNNEFLIEKNIMRATNNFQPIFELK